MSPYVLYQKARLLKRKLLKSLASLGYPIVLFIPREFLSFNTLLIFARTPIQRVLPEGSSTIRFL